MTKVAFITGASGGIGQAMAENFLKENYQVVLVDLAGEKLLKQAKRLTDKYQLSQDHLMAFNVDISNIDEVKTTVASVIARYHRVDVLFNGAGIARIGGISMSHQDFEKIVKVNLFGTFNCIHEIAPIMKQQSSGYIFNVASRQGKMGGANLAGYASSKFGVVGLSESVLKELINTGVKVTALCVLALI